VIKQSVFSLKKESGIAMPMALCHRCKDTNPKPLKIKPMNSLLLRSLALAVVAGSLCFAQVASAATISFYGYEIDQYKWRSTDFTKTISLAPNGSSTIVDPSGAYGKSGWLLPTIANNTYLPSYAPLSGITTPGTIPYYSPSYAQNVDDPTQPISGDVASLPPGYSTIAYQNPGAGGEANLYNFTLSGTIPNSFMMGIAFGNLASPAEDSYGTGSFRAGLNGGAGTGQLAAIANNGLIDWLFFRVDNAVPNDTINIYGTGGTSGMASVAAISFDPIPVPEPSTFALLGLAGFGLALHRLRRRRRTS
jgi:hypothetical protein